MNHIKLPARLAMLPDLLRALAQGSNCQRRKVACVLASNEGEVYTAIYNASVAPPVCQRPDEEGNCGCLHAEIRAAIYYRRDRPPDVALVSAAPCERCAKVLQELGVKHVYFLEESRPQDEGFVIFERAGITYGKIDETSRSFGSQSSEAHP